MTPATVFAALVAATAVAVASTLDYPAALATDAIVQEIRAREPDHYDRCPKHQTDYRTLRYEVAHRADGGDWIVICAYSED